MTMTHIWTVGSRVSVLRDIDLQPHTIVRAGEQGTVTYVDEDFIDVLLDRAHAGLATFGNTAWLCPAYDDIASYVQRVASCLTPLGVA